MRCLLYKRVSSTEQREEGVSLDAQEARLRAYCTYQGHEIVDVIADEGVSAKNLKRPGIQRALKMLAAKDADAILVTRLDRLSRSVRDIMDIIEKSRDEHWDLVSLSEALDTGSAMGRFVVVILSGIAQMTRELIAENTKDALSHLRTTGKRYCRHAPYGWKHVGGNLVVDEAEMKMMEQADDWISDRCDLWSVVRSQNVRNCLTRKGDPWTVKALKAAHQSWQRQRALEQPSPTPR